MCIYNMCYNIYIYIIVILRYMFWSANVTKNNAAIAAFKGRESNSHGGYHHELLWCLRVIPAGSPHKMGKALMVRFFTQHCTES